MLLVQVQLFGTDTKYDLEILLQLGKKINNKGQKILRSVSNSPFQQQSERWKNDNISLDCVIKQLFHDKNTMFERKNNNTKTLLLNKTFLS